MKRNDTRRRGQGGGRSLFASKRSEHARLRADTRESPRNITRGIRAAVHAYVSNAPFHLPLWVSGSVSVLPVYVVAFSANNRPFHTWRKARFRRALTGKRAPQWSCLAWSDSAPSSTATSKDNCSREGSADHASSTASHSWRIARRVCVSGGNIGQSGIQRGGNIFRVHSDS